MLLFLWTLSLYNLLYSRFASKEALGANTTLIVQSALCSIFSLFVILMSNPFQLNPVRVSEGLGLNPLLQDVALVIHPPILYMGYVGFSVIFSIAVSYCYNSDKMSIVKEIKPWLLFTWSVLTLGIGLGAWWAYRELGWGGFWFWDPVENISLLPWLIGLALIHVIGVSGKSKILDLWVIFLSMLTFIVIVVGTFLVRSGVLNSVHSFAENPEQSMYAVIIVLLISVFAITSYVILCKNYTTKAVSGDRMTLYQGSLILNNVLVIIFTCVIIAGLFYPLFAQYFQSLALIIPPSYYDSVLKKIMLPFLLLWIIGPQLSLRKNIIQDNIVPCLCAMIFILCVEVHSTIISCLLFLNVWLLSYLVFSQVSKLACLSTLNPLKILRSITGINRSFYAMFVSHFGCALLVLSIILNSTFSIMEEKYLNVGDSLVVDRYKLTLKTVFVEEESNYKSLKAILKVNNSFELSPEIRFYTVEEQNTPEVAIYHGLISNLYVVVSEFDSKLGLGVQVHYNKAINLIWASVILIIIGATLNIRKKKS